MGVHSSHSRHDRRQGASRSCCQFSMNVCTRDG
jgi:hypothetical protein